jgi:tRNA(Ile)-lysidine synthase
VAVAERGRPLALLAQEPIVTTDTPDLNPAIAASRFGQRLERLVLRFAREQGLFVGQERVLLAVSGGPDSVALLLILAHLREALDLELWVAHFDHGLRRRAEREAERSFVSRLTDELGLPFLFGQGDTRAHACQHRQSLEEAARALRYAFLSSQAERVGASAVATGHTASDQVETVLMHIIRGSGLAGIAGMQPRSPWPFPGHVGLALVRPLLAVSHGHSERYCQEEGLSPRLDVTNLLLEPLRNRVRHELLPLLRRYNPRVEQALLRLADAASADVAYLDETAHLFWQALAQRSGSTVQFPRMELAALSTALQSRLLLAAAQHLIGEATQVEAVHLGAMQTALGDRGNRRLSLPGGLVFVAQGQSVRLMVGEEAPAQPIPETPLALLGRTEVAGWRAEAEILPAEAAGPTDDRYEAFFDLDAIGSTLTVRSRRSGDRLRPLGLGGEKKLQDLLVDAKVPQDQRDGVPLVCAAWGIAWVVGHRQDERAKVGPSARTVLRLRFRRSKS